MPYPEKGKCTAEDYWNSTEDQRAELINGQLIMMAPPGRIHQKIVRELYYSISSYIKAQNGNCEIYMAPFAVNLNQDDTTWVEPDICVICDSKKLTDRGCEGAPDFVIEVVSSGSRRLDYTTKMTMYSDAGVREYWIVDFQREFTTVYHFEEDAAPLIIPFDHMIQSGIYEDLKIKVADLL